MALKLVITKGPREGETLEYPPGSTIRIGRVVRGNNLTIKDSGISSKHISVWSESGKWIVRDLDSSNGSLLNDEALDPEVPVDLSDGDCIKIGETTSISVKIEDLDGSRLRRNPRRGAASAAVESVAGNRGRRGRAAKEIDENSEAVDVVEVGAENGNGNPRRGRGRKARVLKSVAEEEEESREVLGLGAKQFEDVRCVEEEKPGRRQVSSSRTRSSKNEETAVSGSVLGKIPENSDAEGGVVKVGAKKTRGGTRRKNSPQKKPDCVMIDAEDDGSINRLNLGEQDCEKAFSELGVGNTGEMEDNVNAYDKNDNENDCGVRVIFNEAEKGSGSGCKETLDGSGKEPDLEKMTLGEWFDYLEIDLPKQIFKATEEMIMGMRLKAQRVREYMVEQKNEKAKVPVG
ncbi:Serine/threonine protein kinase [Trema orientale]|uniref:Serine/threonine protein kinase n=1 Tax=Trema orientale TaxID=63057 RepID=A0A2P5ECS0_TREOI|nr:Serine/threonine protein kinase [Trema orientale]